MGARNQQKNIKSILHVTDERRIWPKGKRGITGGAIWSYRALDLAMDLQVGRSLTWAGSSGLFSPRERNQVAVSAYLCWFLSGGTKVEKINMS